MTMQKILAACLFLSQTLTTAVCDWTASHEQPRVEQQQAAQAKQPIPTSAGHGGPEWHAAAYRGLTMGKSTDADMRRVFGEPNAAETFDAGVKNPEIWFFYDRGGEFPGKLIVGVNKRNNVVRRLILHPESLSKEEAIKHFGDDYVVSRYDFDKCLGDGDSAPLYESPSGAVVRIEYRQRGITISLNYKDVVNHISYVSEPVGAPESRCRH